MVNLEYVDNKFNLYNNLRSHLTTGVFLLMAAHTYNKEKNMQTTQNYFD